MRCAGATGVPRTALAEVLPRGGIRAGCPGNPWQPLPALGEPANRNRRETLLRGLLHGAATPHAVPRPHRTSILATSGWAATRRAPGMGRAQADPLEHVHMKILTNTRAVLSGLAVAGIATAGIALGAAPAQAAPTSVWDRVAACESGGNWHINTGNGYYGGLQFSLSTWQGYGGSGNPADASKSTQIAIAEKVLAGQGWGAWPVCSVKARATGTSSAAGTSSTSAASSSRSSAPSASQQSSA